MKKKFGIFILTFLIVVVLGGTVLFLVAQNRNGDTVLVNGGQDAVDAASENNIAETEIVSADEIMPPEELQETEVTSEQEDIPEEILDERTFRLEPSEDGSVVFAFAGDILFDPYYAIFSSYHQRGDRIEECISEELLAEMHNADIMMLNNEFPYTDRGTPTPGKIYTFRADTESVSVLKDMGVDIVSIANNHTYDYGEISLLDTLDTLEQAEIPYVGAGRNIEEAVKPVYYLLGDMKIAVIGATQIERLSAPNTRGATETSPGVFRCLQPDLLVETIRTAKEECDFVILYIHWGTESTDQLDWCQVEQAPLYVEAGADIIIGDHPHCLQEIGYIDGVPIVYSLGNFWFNSRTMDSCIVKLTLSEEGIQSLQFVPCLQSGCRVSMLEGEERDRVLSYMRGISSTAQIDEEGFVTDPAAVSE